MKKIVVHMPAPMPGNSIEPRLNDFFEKLCFALKQLELDFSPHKILKDKDMRRNTDYNHIVFHTHKKLENWLHTQIAYLPDFFYLDREGFSGWSSIRNEKFDPNTIDLIQAETYVENLGARYINKFQSKFGEDGEKDSSDIPEGAICVFLQTFGDEVLKLAHVSQEEMVRAAIRHQHGRPIVIKRHPYCFDPLSNQLVLEAQSWGKHITSTTANVHAILPKADKVVCVNSGVGFEALLHRKHVVTLGRCDYHHVTANSKNSSNVDAAFEKPRVSRDIITKYVYWFLTTQVIDSKAENFNTRVKEQLQKRGWI